MYVPSRPTTTINDMNARDPLIGLAGPKCPEYKDFMGSENNPAQFVMGGGSFLPKTLAKDRPGAHLAFSVVGGKIAKKIVLTVKIAGSNIKKLHHIHLEMFAGAGQATNLTYENFVASGADQSEADCSKVTHSISDINLSALEITPSTAGATPSASEFAPSVSHATLSATELTPSASDVTSTVTPSAYEITPSASEVTLSQATPSGVTPSEVNPSNTSQSEEVSGLLLVKWQTTGGHGTGLLLPTAEYDGDAQDIMEYLKSLVYSRKPEVQEVKLIVKVKQGLREQLDTVAQNANSAKPWQPYLDDKFKPRCCLQSMASRKALEAYCGRLIRFPAKNSFASVEEAHIHLAYGLYLEYRKAPDQALRSSWPRTVREAVYLKCQLEALALLFNRNASTSTTLWPRIILNKATEALPIIDPTEKWDVAEDVVAGHMETVMAAFSWTDEQVAAIKMCRALRGKVGIVEGVPGSGKTHVLAGMAIFYALCSAGVLMFAPTAAQATALSNALSKLLDLTGNTAMGVMKLYPDEIAYTKLKKANSLTSSRNLSFIITTPNAICERSLSHHLGKDHQKFIVMHDDSDSSLETEVIATVFGLQNPEVVCGMILAGDVKEWPLDVVTQVDMVKCMSGDGPATDDTQTYSSMFTRFFKQDGGWYDPIQMRDEILPPPKAVTEPAKPKNNGKESSSKKQTLEFYGGYNEFADQIGLALLTRLRRQGFVTAKLLTQHRMQPLMTEFLNKRTYRHAMRTSTIVEHRSTSSDFNTLLRLWLREEARDKDMSVVYLKASVGMNRCIKSRRSKSKHNCRNVEVTLELVLRNEAGRVMPGTDILIITPYSDQVRLYNQVFDEKQKRGQLNAAFRPKVATVDQSRGREARVVIFDLVVTCADRFHSNGIVADELRAKVAVSRAQEFLIIVGSSEFIDVYPQFYHWLMIEGRKPNEPLPFLVQYAEALHKQGRGYTPKTEYGSEIVFVKRDTWKREEDCDHTWGNWIHRTDKFDRNDE